MANDRHSFSENLVQDVERTFIAGSSGLVGQAFVRRMDLDPSVHLICCSSNELDLTQQESVREFFEKESPDRVILAAGRVGGIQANIDFPGQMLYENILIAGNVIHNAFAFGTKKLLYFGSSCMFPKACGQPMREADLLSGSLEPSNEAYALAKLSGLKLAESYNTQYGTKYRTVIPGNLYGPCDRFSEQNSHVIPALIRKFHNARENMDREVVVWGSGAAQREFLFVDDLVDACFFLDDFPDILGPVNVGANQSVSIRDLTILIKEVVDYPGKIRFDQSKPDGAPARKLDSSQLDSRGWHASTALIEGLTQTYDWFLNNR